MFGHVWAMFIYASLRGTRGLKMHLGGEAECCAMPRHQGTLAFVELCLWIGMGVLDEVEPNFRTWA